MESRRNFFSLFDGAVHYAPGATNDDVLKECGNCEIQFRGQNCPIANCRNISVAVSASGSPFRGFSPIPPLRIPLMSNARITPSPSLNSTEAQPKTPESLSPTPESSLPMAHSRLRSASPNIPENNSDDPDATLVSPHCSVPAARNESMQNVVIPATNDEELRQCLKLAMPLKAVLDEVRQKKI